MNKISMLVSVDFVLEIYKIEIAAIIEQMPTIISVFLSIILPDKSEILPLITTIDTPIPASNVKIAMIVNINVVFLK